MLKKSLWGISLSTALALLTFTNGVAGVGPLVRASALASPYAACASQDAAQIAAVGGRNFLNAEVEPQIAIRGSHAIGMWHEDRWSNGGAHGIGLGTSSDGGSTWTNGTMPFDACAPGTPASLAIYLRNSDPWVSYGPDGIAYASALSFNLGYPNNYNAVAVARSTDNGATWDHAQPIPGSAFTQFAQSTDKNSTTADPTRNNTAYTVWDTLIEPTDNPDDNPKTAAYTGPAYFSKTTDGGKTWSQAKIIIDTGNRQQTIGNVIVVDSSGTLYDFTNMLLPPNTPFQGTNSHQVLAFVKSTDGGDTWTKPQLIVPFNSLGVQDPNTGERLRVGDGLEEVAIDPASGKLYVVYESSSNYNKNAKKGSALWDDEILLVSSSDAGATWAGPIVVHKLASGLPTFTPTVAVNGGTVAVTYFDTRFLTAGQTTNLPTDYWVSYSTDGGATWGNEQRITPTSFDSRTAPVARGFFLGDYEGLQPMGSGFAALFVKTNCNSTDTAGQVFPTGGACAPASSTSAATSNTNPTDAFLSVVSP